LKWKKIGHIYGPDGSQEWARSHAANPTAQLLDGDNYRIYFSTRDASNRSSVGFVEIDLSTPTLIRRKAYRAVISPGAPTMFDDSGVSIGCIVPVGTKQFLYYMGWNLTIVEPWQNSLGLAISQDGGDTFDRHSNFPIVPCDGIDPHTLSYPWVMWDSERFRMWYGSSIAWGPKNEDMRHLIKYGESDDGIHWRRTGHVAIDFKDTSEYAICRPCVVREGNLYRMWFCARGSAYRIGYAESSDGLSWQRMDNRAGIDVSNVGWDSQMIEYPFVFDHRGVRYLLYCGNEYGKDGFGLAVLEQD
jgi:hypothetical protein